MAAQGPSLLHAYRTRNLVTKQWVESSNSSNIVFIDFDAMSLSRHAPPICVEENWHYQCFLTWPAATNKVRRATCQAACSAKSSKRCGCELRTVGLQCWCGVCSLWPITREDEICSHLASSACLVLQAVLHDTETNYFRDRVYRAPLTGLYMTEDGQCFDEMNRNVWNIAFNLIMK